MSRYKQVIVFCVLALLSVGVVLRVARDLAPTTRNSVPPGSIWGEVAPAIVGVVLLIVFRANRRMAGVIAGMGACAIGILVLSRPEYFSMIVDFYSFDPYRCVAVGSIGAAFRRGGWFGVGLGCNNA